MPANGIPGAVADSSPLRAADGMKNPALPHQPRGRGFILSMIV